MGLIHSLYVHVPFCKSKCPYCDFFSVSDFSLLSDYKKAVLEELSLRSPNFVSFPTVYFGGGTPSTLSVDFFYSILYSLGQFSEVTIEINPEDAKKDFLLALKEIGVNRISIGVQTFSDKLLKILGRRQTSLQNLKSLENVLSIFENVSIDIIYGIPEQTLKDLEKDLEIATSFPIKHISTYALTVYEGTLFEKLEKSGKISLPSDSILSEMYYILREFLVERGFNHYEISNFAFSGFESKHNLSYWKLKNYLGLGASAASYVNGKWWKNVSSVEEYVSFLNNSKLPTSDVVVYQDEEEKELKILMGLRLIAGINLDELELTEKFKERLEKNQKLKFFLEEEFLVFEKPTLRLGEKGYFVSNTVISEVISALF
ncbi:MAG: radical SAM family heme chaperone HemW [Desulfurobacteriaceae bacterium]